MSADAPIRVGLIGYGLAGASFHAPLITALDAFALTTVVTSRADAVAQALPDARVEGDVAGVLADPAIDLIVIAAPDVQHAPLARAALAAGKHVACAVPMATTLDDLARVVEAARASGRNYMMMETSVYTREFLYAREIDYGRLTFLRGSHIQDIEGLPDYWRGYPFMLYATHAVAPLLALAGTRAAKAICLGSGTLPDRLVAYEGNRFPLETALFRLHDSDLAAEVTGSFFLNARPYVESFCAYGDRRGFEWEQLWDEGPLLIEMEPFAGLRDRPIHARRIAPPYRPDLLPPALAPFAEGGHGGSHPHLVHEFVRSVVEGRPPAIDAPTAADWTAPGICAHLSALRDGEPVVVPSFRSAGARVRTL